MNDDNEVIDPEELLGIGVMGLETTLLMEILNRGRPIPISKVSTLHNYYSLSFSSSQYIYLSQYFSTRTT